MIVRVLYTTQLKHTLGRGSDEVELPGPMTVGHVLEHLSQLHGEPFDHLVFAGQGKLTPSILICVGTECLGRDLSAQLNEGDELTLLSPVSGG